MVIASYFASATDLEERGRGLNAWHYSFRPVQQAIASILFLLHWLWHYSKGMDVITIVHDAQVA